MLCIIVVLLVSVYKLPVPAACILSGFFFFFDPVLHLTNGTKYQNTNYGKFFDVNKYSIIYVRGLT